MATDKAASRHIIDRAVKLESSLNLAHRVDVLSPEAEGGCASSFNVNDEFIQNVKIEIINQDILFCYE